MTQQVPLGRLSFERRGLPRGRSSLPASDVEAAHRDRLTHAVIGVVADNGYADTAVADIVAAARVSRAVFYTYFASKEECFLAACFQGLGLLMSAIGERVSAAPVDPPEAELRATVVGFLQFLADEPAFARCFLLEMPAAGTEARHRYLGVVELLAGNLRDWHERFIAGVGSGQPLDHNIYRILVGGAAQVCTARVHLGDTASIPELEEPVMAACMAILVSERPRL